MSVNVYSEHVPGCIVFSSHELSLIAGAMGEFEWKAFWDELGRGVRIVALKRSELARANAKIARLESAAARVVKP